MTQARIEESPAIQPEWIFANEAAEILGVNRHIIDDLAESRRITRRVIPGTYPRYLRADVVQLAEQCTVAKIEC